MPFCVIARGDQCDEGGEIEKFYPFLPLDYSLGSSYHSLLLRNGSITVAFLAHPHHCQEEERR